MGSCDVKSVLVKLGGRAADREECLRELFAEMAALSDRFRFLLVHGGGAEVTRLSRSLGIEAVFKDGVRQTSPDEMDIVEMVLSGKVNKRLVRLCRGSGLNAVGVSGPDGGIFTGRLLDPESRTAEVDAIDRGLLDLLLENGYLPVISPTSMDGEGRGVNINADAVAFRLASELVSFSLVFLSDIPGIMMDGKLIPEISAAEGQDLIGRGVITGGMIPKVHSSLEAIQRGVEHVIIGQYEKQGALQSLLEGKMGTRIRG
jgi:acetylglutamate kinase